MIMFIRTAFKLMLMAALLIVSLSAAASMATASSLTIIPAGNITATSQGLLSYTTTIGGTPVTLLCTITLAGTLERGPIPATTGSHMGALTRDLGSSCNNVLGQNVIVQNLLPWLYSWNRDVRIGDEVIGFLFDVLWRVLWTIQALNKRCLYSAVRGQWWRIATATWALLQIFNVPNSRESLTSPDCGALNAPAEPAFNVTPRQTITEIP
jgi:hypothetical protein